jgi:hypothetical protein
MGLVMIWAWLLFVVSLAFPVWICRHLEGRIEALEKQIGALKNE